MIKVGDYYKPLGWIDLIYQVKDLILISADGNVTADDVVVLELIPEHYNRTAPHNHRLEQFVGTVTKFSIWHKLSSLEVLALQAHETRSR